VPRIQGLTKGEETRREIIRQAAPIFNRKGFAGAALSELMRATGLEKGGIYRHFKSKQQLAVEAFDYAWSIARDTRLGNTEEIPNSVDRLQQIVRNFRDRRTGLVPGGCPLLNTAIDSDNGNFLLSLRSVVQQGQRRGEIGSEVDPAELAAVIVGTLEGSLMLARLQRSEKPLDQACRHLEKFIETEVRAPKSANPKAEL
jgi:TetR/AcrR family transcriptional repressor of nem operon